MTLVCEALPTSLISDLLSMYLHGPYLGLGVGLKPSCKLLGLGFTEGGELSPVPPLSGMMPTFYSKGFNSISAPDMPVVRHLPG